MGSLESLLVGVFGVVVPWIALVVIAFVVIGLLRGQGDATQAQRVTRGMAALGEIDADLHTLDVERALVRAEDGTADRADLAWLASVVQRAGERRPEVESAFWKVVPADHLNAKEQTLRHAAARATEARIEARGQRIAACVPAVRQEWLDPWGAARLEGVAE